MKKNLTKFTIRAWKASIVEKIEVVDLDVDKSIMLIVEGSQKKGLIMTQYLIVKCDELGDQWECDADRTPMFMTDDWKSNAPSDYQFEVYELRKDNTFECIREYEDYLETGYCFVMYKGGEEEIIRKWANEEFCAQNHWDFIRQYLDEHFECHEDYMREDEWEEMFYWPDKDLDILYVYSNYQDNRITTPF